MHEPRRLCHPHDDRYRARTEAATERVVDPDGILFQSGRWYLTGWDHLRGAERTFRLDRTRVTR